MTFLSYVDEKREVEPGRGKIICSKKRVGFEVGRSVGLTNANCNMLLVEMS